jgi:hypothetical protein
MPNTTPTELVERCTQARRHGADFPTVWQTVLRGNPLVAGIPRQRVEGARSLLDIPLITGQSVVYDGDRSEFSLQWLAT